MKAKLERRLVLLYGGETISIFLFIIVSFMLNKFYPQIRLYSLYSFWCSFFFLEFLLAQGSVYWYSKWKRLKREGTSVTPSSIVRLLKRFKKYNVGLIILSPFVIIIDIYVWYPLLSLNSVLIVTFIYIFAILEYINYFYIQLSYDNLSDIKHLLKTRKLKQACLNKDFERMM
ncbi:general stress protein [Bacillus solimangrovi]|uniref:General stress protein n=1 Tax=Bacillus solimangrovi TaxID=1305675 RepID=A0A1E5LEU2_9BACI|nr:general stress protein [Bacillus solimangrovi]OEH92598.1 general stress protein [Bacillus solimangrovi]